MTSGLRIVAACSTVLLLLAGPLAPPVKAQQPMPPPPPATVQPVPPAQPDVFQEAVKTGRTGVPAEDYEFGRPMSRPFYNTAAGVANVFYVPGHAITCALGGGVAGAILVLTFGSGYRTATRMVEEGCGGKWILQGDDLLPDRQSIRSMSEPR
jgi:hypothetical protein